jgi:hypothetical protein
MAKRNDDAGLAVPLTRVPQMPAVAVGTVVRAEAAIAAASAAHVLGLAPTLEADFRRAAALDQRQVPVDELTVIGGHRAPILRVRRATSAVASER